MKLVIDINHDYANVIAGLTKRGLVYGEIFRMTQKHATEGRWWDVWHNEITTANMIAILEGEDEETMWHVLVPAAILHDIGWSQLGEGKNSNWDDRNLRIAHMKVGGILADTILRKVKYPQQHIVQIRELVEHHDDEYLGIKPTSHAMQLLRDADASFILSYPSFWKDWKSKGTGKSPMIFLKKQVANYGKRFTQAAQRIVDREIQLRKSEIEAPGDYVKRIQEIAKAKKKLYQKL